MGINYKLAETQQKFQSFYKTNLQQIYRQLEETRKRCLNSLKNRLICFFLFFGGIYYLCLNDIIKPEIYSSDFFVNVAVIVFLIFCGAIYQPFSEYREKTKDTTMQKILSFWGKFDYFLEHDIIGNEIVKKSELFSYYNRAEADDAFTGKYSKTKLTVSEHNLRIQGSKGNTHIFRGVLILLDFTKKFAGKTVVINKGRKKNFFLNNPIFILIPLFILGPWVALGWKFIEDKDGLLLMVIPLLFYTIIGFAIYLFFKKISKKKATQNVTLEKMEFNKNWNVLTDNQVEARYVLNPTLMEQIEEIKHLFYGKSIDFSLFDNKLLIAVHTRKNLFETTSLFSPALNYHKVREVVSQLYSIFSVIEVLEKSGK
ncbi:MAG: DUF3137 domain-containing protein [Alphaproteobacteria bacterium]|nr:DUF3137 domain-containing protein [Alphaproteobacteria bacterium]